MSIKKHELEPTDKNVYDSIVSDTLARNKYVWRFCKLLNEIDDSFVLALDAKWGEGKTFFVKQTKMFIESYSGALDKNKYDTELINGMIENFVRQDHYEKNLKSQLCFYYDSWENDDDDEPVLSLLYSMARQMDVDLNDKNIIGLLSSVAKPFIKVDVSEISKEYKESIFKEKKTKEEIKIKISNFLKDIHIEKGDRTIIFIDELDRCRPVYAIKLLERVKHYFDFENITFVFSVNLTELQHTVKEYYGEEFDGYGYLNRFFDHTLNIPQADLEEYLEKIDSDYSQEYFEIYAKEFVKKYNLSVRETEKYIRALRIAIGTWLKSQNISNYYNDEEKYSWSMIGSIMIPIMIGLKIKDIDIFNKFIRGEGINEFLELTSDMTEKCYFTEALKNGEETYEKIYGEERNYVSESERLSYLYEYVFNDNGVSTPFTKKVGKISIFGDMREKLINACSMLSDYTLFDKDEEIVEDNS